VAKGKKLSELEKKSKHTIDSAKKEFGTVIKGYAIKWKITSDDGGRILEAFCEDWDACGALREKIPSKYMGFRTIVIGYALTEDKEALRNFSYEDE
jgi:hypothetical protein